MAFYLNTKSIFKHLCKALKNFYTPLVTSAHRRDMARQEQRKCSVKVEEEINRKSQTRPDC